MICISLPGQESHRVRAEPGPHPAGRGTSPGATRTLRVWASWRREAPRWDLKAEAGSQQWATICVPSTLMSWLHLLPLEKTLDGKGREAASAACPHPGVLVAVLLLSEPLPGQEGNPPSLYSKNKAIHQHRSLQITTGGYPQPPTLPGGSPLPLVCAHISSSPTNSWSPVFSVSLPLLSSNRR